MEVNAHQTKAANRGGAGTKLPAMLCIAIALTLVAPAAVCAQQSAARLLQSGLYQEEVKGDLDEAIKIYERILASYPKDRPIAAKALLHIGLCYETLGKQEARKHYQHLIKEYSDQPETVRIARQHLEQLDAGAPVAQANGPTYSLALDDQIAGMPVDYADFSPKDDRLVFRSQGKLYIADQTGTVIRPILDDSGPWKNPGWLHWSPDGRQIAYRASREVPADSGKNLVAAIFVLSPDGGEPRQIGPELTGRGNVRWIHWTDDGRHIAYFDDQGIHILALDGSEIRVISRKDLPPIRWDVRTRCKFSPNGRWLAYSTTRETSMDRDIWILSATGGQPQRLTNLPGLNFQQTWAPNGRDLYFIHGPRRRGAGNIWKVSIDPETGRAKSQPQQVTFFNDTLIFHPKVLGDGDRIVFHMMKQNTSIQVADAASPQKARAVVRSDKYPPELSPDGQTVYFVNAKPGEQGIYAVPRQGGAPQRLSESVPQAGHGFTISPDGRTLAYVTTFGESRGLVTVPASGGEPKLLTRITAHGGVVPQWSPDGSQLAYANHTAECPPTRRINGLYVIPAAGGTPRELAHQEQGWLAGWTVRWSPDGKYLAALGSDHNREELYEAVFVVPASGGKLRKLTPDDGRKEGLGWHPDGKRLTYHVPVNDGETRQAHLDGRPPSLLVNTPDISDYSGNWAPDGRRFFFRGDDDEKGWCLYVYDETSGKTTLVSGLGGYAGVPRWSRDGKTMAWWASRATRRQFWIMENFQTGDVARAPGAADDKTASAKSLRQVWAPALDTHGKVSPDGRYISHVNRSQGNLAVHELATGENRDLMDEGTYGQGPSEMCDYSAWSPDSRRIAYCGFTGRRFDLRIVGIDGSGPRVLCHADPEKGNAPYPLDWSQDGKHILADLEQGGEHHIVLVSVEDGSVRTLKSLGTQVPGRRMALSPDGRYVVYPLQVEPDSKMWNIHILATDGSLDAPLVEHPGRDGMPFWTPDGKRVLFLSDRSGSFGFWLLDVKEGRAQGPPTAIHETQSGFRGLGFTQDGSFYYAISNTGTDVYCATLDLEAGTVLSPPAKTSLRVEGSNHAPVWSSDGKQLAYFSSRGIGSPHALIVRSLKTGEERDVSIQSGLEPYINPGFGLAQWSPDGRSILVRGHTNAGWGLYLIDVETGGFTALLQDKPEDGGSRVWPVFSKDGKKVYHVYSLPRNGRPSAIMAHDLESGDDAELYRTAQGVRKLALSPDGRQLAFCEKEKDGKFVLKTMPISGGEPRKVFTVPDFRSFVRELGLSWTSDGDHLVVAYPNKHKDLWVIPVAGGEPRTVKLGARAFGLRLHPDGQRIAFTAGRVFGNLEVWALENFLPNPPTGDYFVTQSEDDAEEYADGSYSHVDSSDLDIGQVEGGKERVVGVRFADIRIPKGTRIKNAYLQFAAEHSGEAEPANLTIHAELAASAKAFSEAEHNISSRRKTNASVKWSPVPWKVKGQRSANQRTPDLSSLIQEVIDQPDWQEGNALVLIITGSGERDAMSFDAGQGYAPSLDIEY